MTLSCLIVDDEPPAHKILENYIGKLNSLSLAGNCHNAVEALNFLHETPVDILFLDINMPELSGLDMLRTMANPPIVILTTAYSEFAMESYEFGVLDYLLKPIRFERFLKAVNRVLALKETAPSPAASTPKKETAEQPKEAFFFVKSDGVQYKVEFKDIQHIESKGNFVQLHLESNKILTADTLSNMEQKLSPYGFLRIHKSYIINKEKIDALEGNQLIIGKVKIPIGNSYRQIVRKTLDLDK